MNNPLVFTIIAALGFGGWPLIVRAYSLSPITTSLAVSGGTFVVVGSFAVLSLTKAGGIGTGALVPCLIAGVLNGVGFVAYTMLVSNSSWAASHVPVSIVLMIAVITLGGILWFHDAVSFQRIAGFCFGAISVYLLTR